MTLAEVKMAAMELNPIDRETLAEEILLSLSQSDRDTIEAQWVAEAKRRTAEFRAGRSGTTSVDVVMERLLNKART